jgi:hypothetical protein
MHLHLPSDLQSITYFPDPLLSLTLSHRQHVDERLLLHLHFVKSILELDHLAYNRGANSEHEDIFSSLVTGGEEGEGT